MSAAGESMENKISGCFGRMDIFVGRYLLGKKAGCVSSDPDSLKKIGLGFLDEITSVLPQATLDQETLKAFIVEEEPGRTAKPGAKVSGKPAKAKAKRARLY